MSEFSMLSRQDILDACRRLRESNAQLLDALRRLERAAMDTSADRAALWEIAHDAIVKAAGESAETQRSSHNETTK